MDENKIIEALKKYDGSQELLEQTVAVLSNELGNDWTSLVFEKLGDLPVDLKEKLNHAFNYYASLTAWQETQTYLAQTEPLDHTMIAERMPILKHWLDFFGDPGKDLYQQLENRLNTLTDTIPEQNSNAINISDEASLPTQSESQDTISKVEEPEMKNEPALDSPEAFMVQKAQKQIQLLDSLQAWLSARCHELGDIESFAYPYYGLVVDLMRQVVKEIQSICELPDSSVVEAIYSGGMEALRRKKEAIESDIKIAVENCESATTALIEKGMDMDKVKQTLGSLDTNTEPEYLGPAPDGFELMEEEIPLNENAIKEQYQELEKNAQENSTSEILSAKEKKTSQNDKNGVQRKLSFSLKPKKTEG